jgi:DNA invertase Pin-like site-specific DNA recombinase
MQANEGVSLDAQVARAKAWAEANGFTVGGVHYDAGISGKKAKNRPGLQTALTEACAARGNAIVVYSLSRLARSTKDAIEIGERLAKAGADLVSLTESIDTTTAAGKMIFGVLAVLAQFERDLVSERTRAALSFKASRGERIGEIPYGFTLDAGGVQLRSNPEEQATLVDLRTMRDAGMTWRVIAEALNARGLRTKKGRLWTWQNSRRLIAA